MWWFHNGARVERHVAVTGVRESLAAWDQCSALAGGQPQHVIDGQIDCQHHAQAFEIVPVGQYLAKVHNAVTCSGKIEADRPAISAHTRANSSR